MQQDGDRLAGFDFAAHNEEQARMWTAFRDRRPFRTPVILGVSSRFYMFNPAANPEGLDYQTYTEDASVMFAAQLRFKRWDRFNIRRDVELGAPTEWQIGVDFQNYYEAAWLDCPVYYSAGQVPDVRPAFAESPEAIMENGLPDPFGGYNARGLEYYEYFQERARRETFMDRPIKIAPPGFGLGTDGIMTLACSLFGPDLVCLSMAAEPARLHRLLDFITEATIARIKAWRVYLDQPERTDGGSFADDSIALISTAMYREHILPYHRRLAAALWTDAPRTIHLCGDATHHFVTLRDELNVQSFDTGFPVDFGQLRGALGPEVQIQGGPAVEFLRTAEPAAVRAEVRRILTSGVLDGGRFILREGNNLAPGTPLANTEAMYHAAREFGRFE